MSPTPLLDELGGAQPLRVHHAGIVHRQLMQLVVQAACLLVEPAAELVDLRSSCELMSRWVGACVSRYSCVWVSALVSMAETC